MSKISKLEAAVIKILNAAAIPFIPEKQFKDCHHGYYRFDFYLPKLNIILECDGQQHYKFTKIFHKTRTDFLKGQERDRRKNSYCLANEIKLYRIPYWEMENLKVYEDLIQPEFEVKNKYHNDAVWREHQKNSKHS